MSYTTFDSTQRHRWMALLALLPACPGCGGVWHDGVTSRNELCIECLERSRESIEEELGGEA
jgi:hypothetical protein